MAEEEKTEGPREEGPEESAPPATTAPSAPPAPPAPEDEPGGEAAEGAPPAEGSPAELMPLDLSTFILSLSSSVLMNLGVVENPVTKKTEKEPAAAKQTMDLIELLKDKTRGNLTEEEAKLFDDVLYELRLWYCKVVG